MHDSSDDIANALRPEVYPYVQVTWEIHLQRWFHISVGVFQPLGFDPVIYAPIVGISLRFNTVETQGPFRPEQPKPPPPPPSPALATAPTNSLRRVQG